MFVYFNDNKSLNFLFFPKFTNFIRLIFSQLILSKCTLFEKRFTLINLLCNRQVEISSAEPTQDQVDLSKLIMKKLRFTYDSSCFDNPALQTHYKALEAMALDLPSPQPVQDFTSKMHHLFELTNNKL